MERNRDSETETETETDEKRDRERETQKRHGLGVRCGCRIRIWMYRCKCKGQRKGEIWTQSQSRVTIVDKRRSSARRVSSSDSDDLRQAVIFVQSCFELYGEYRPSSSVLVCGSMGLRLVVLVQNLLGLSGHGAD